MIGCGLVQEEVCAGGIRVVPEAEEGGAEG